MKKNKTALLLEGRVMKKLMPYLLIAVMIALGVSCVVYLNFLPSDLAVALSLISISAIAVLMFISAELLKKL